MVGWDGSRRKTADWNEEWFGYVWIQDVFDVLLHHLAAKAWPQKADNAFVCGVDLMFGWEKVPRC